MTCRSCGAEIADKAIVCFRCGTPTAGPPPPVRPGRAGQPNWLAVPVILVIIALAVWLVPKTPAGTTARWGAWAAVVVVTAGSVTLLRRRR